MLDGPHFRARWARLNCEETLMKSLPHVGLRVLLPPRAAFPLLVLLFVLAGCATSDIMSPTSRFPAGTAPGTTQFWVNLRSRAQLQAAANISDYAARGRFVMEELQRTAAASQGPVITFLEQHNAKFVPFWVANVIWVEADDETRTLVAQLPEVASVEPEQSIALDDPQAIAAPAPQAIRDASGLTIGQNVSRINAPQVWDQGITGKGVVVGIMDTGFAPHPAITPKYRGYQGSPSSFNNKYNWYDSVGVPRCQTPCDGNGHGTHVTGTVVGRDGSDAIGVAPDAQFIACRALNNSGSGTGQTVVACLQWFLAPTDTGGGNANSAYRPNIINMSLGSGSLPTGVADAMRNLRAAGTLPVAAAGNSGGCGLVGYPGALGDVVAVGSLTADASTNKVSTFSSTGPVKGDAALVKPDVMAQGEAVRSSWLRGGYNTINGTSMASPSVAGVAALVMSSSTRWLNDPSGVATILLDTANGNVSPGTRSCSQVFGRGLVDANAAVNRALLPVPRRE